VRWNRTLGSWLGLRFSAVRSENCWLGKLLVGASDQPQELGKMVVPGRVPPLRLEAKQLSITNNLILNRGTALYLEVHRERTDAEALESTGAPRSTIAADADKLVLQTATAA
jgi:hypothetical protein